MSKLLNNYAPAIFWMGYHVVFLKMTWSFFGLLMGLRALAILVCFLIREKPLQRAPSYQVAISWIGTFIPIFMVWKHSTSASGLVGDLISISGLALLLLASIDLGKSFGISPALRTPVRSGLYRYLNHPIYTSYVLIELGILISTPTAGNFVIAAVAWGSYALRAEWERQMVMRTIHY